MNKQINHIDYSVHNLPEHIQFSLNFQGNIYYLYDAGGRKLRKQTRSNQALVSQTDYDGSFVYTTNNALEYIITPEGRALPDGSSFKYEYYLKDHLGNTRVVFDQAGTVLQDNSYYPFGMKFEGLAYQTTATSSPNKYLYNGKEYQDDFGLGWYDYGARFYDGVIGRWHSVDPLAQLSVFQSPYLFCSNNPILRIDIFGMQDTISLPPVTIVGKKPAPSLNPADISIFLNNLPKKQNVSKLPEPAPYSSVRDNTEVVGHFLVAATIANKLTGAKLGSNLGIYGANFYGNSSVKILKLAKPIKIGGIMVSMIVLSADAMNAYGNGLQGAEQDAAVEQLVKDVVTTGVYAISAEAGILITVGDYICNSPEMQKFQQDLRMEKDRKNGIWQINTGPSHVRPN